MELHQIGMFFLILLYMAYKLHDIHETLKGIEGKLHDIRSQTGGD
jgi:hypothetical protein